MRCRTPWRKLARLASIVGLAAALTVATSEATAGGGHAHAHAATAHCGSFKYGTDGFQPGPSGIVAQHVSCWFARATALLGPAPGWHCRDVQGLLLVCKPARGNGQVDFFGE